MDEQGKEEGQEEQLVRGSVQRVTFHNPTNGYAVLQLIISGKSEPITVVGSVPHAAVGSELIVRGVYQTHHKFGKQLRATSITETIPSSAEGIEKYLSSGMIKGIGDKTAKRLIDEFGEQTLEMIHKDPDRVAKVAGVGKRRATLLKATLSQTQDIQEILRFLLEHHISQGLATRIYERYGNRAVEIICKDPYILARDLRGVGFATADTIALNLGLKPDSPQRLKAGLYHALDKASDDGHTYLPIQQLIQKTCFLLGLSEEHAALLEPCLTELRTEGYVLRYEEGLYLKHLAKAEEFVAEFIAERLPKRPEPQIKPELVTSCLLQAGNSLGLTFSPEQVDAVHAATHYRLMIITGGPGCGKTTLIRALALMYRSAGKRLSLAAPTGRAAQRMGQVCEMPASTIHRLLKYDPSKHSFLFGINDPLPADAVIIDEASMIDISLAKDLFSAIPKDATLILVGDKDQLPSVGPGKVFGDLISVPEVKTVSLSQLFRRSEESTITSIAHMINSGIIPDIPQPDGVTKTDAYFIPRSDAAEAAETIEKLVAEQIPKKFGFNLHEMSVLTPSNRGELGAEKLNNRIQARLNPPGAKDAEQELEIHGKHYRLGDRVCQRVNNYSIDELGVFNGDVGEVYSIDRKTGSMKVEMWDGRLIQYSTAEISQLSLAYALTVHRSQGSEIPCVILALHDSHFTLLDRQLIYTAVTRAKRLLVVVGSKRALSMATKRTSSRRRNSRLSYRIQGIRPDESRISDDTAHQDLEYINDGQDL